LRVVGVTPLSSPLRQIRGFVTRHGLTYPIVVDPAGKVGKLYEVERYPSIILMDRAGVVRFVHTGFRRGDAEVVEARVQAALRMR
jgi:peroxiredoxin